MDIAGEGIGFRFMIADSVSYVAPRCHADMQFHVFEKDAAPSSNICYPYPYNKGAPYFTVLC